MLFSVVINNYNYGRYLKEAIDSVLMQTFKDFELIVVDDASTDHSLDILQAYKDDLILLQNTENKGQIETFNLAVTHAKGDYICFLDADDVFVPHKLDVLDKAIKAFPDKDLYYHSLYYVDEGLQIITLRSCLMRHGRLRENCLKHGVSGLPATSALCYKKAFLESVMPIDIPLTVINADTVLNLLVCLLGDIQGLPDPLLLYRLHGDNSYANTGFIEGRPEVVFKRRIILERVYLAANHVLQAKNEGIYMDILNSDVYNRYRYVFGERTSFTKLIWEYGFIRFLRTWTYSFNLFRDAIRLRAKAKNFLPTQPT